MSRVDRFSVSLDTELLAAFDALILARGYTNRSEAIRDLLREWLTESRPASDQGEALGVLTLVCDVGIPNTPSRLRKLLATAGDSVSTTVSTAVDSNRDALTVTLRGRVQSIQNLADKIQALRGMTHGHLSLILSND